MCQLRTAGQPPRRAASLAAPASFARTPDRTMIGLRAAACAQARREGSAGCGRLERHGLGVIERQRRVSRGECSRDRTARSLPVARDRNRASQRSRAIRRRRQMRFPVSRRRQTRPRVARHVRGGRGRQSLASASRLKRAGASEVRQPPARLRSLTAANQRHSGYNAIDDRDPDRISHPQVVAEIGWKRIRPVRPSTAPAAT